MTSLLKRERSLLRNIQPIAMITQEFVSRHLSKGVAAFISITAVSTTICDIDPAIRL